MATLLFVWGTKCNSVSHRSLHLNIRGRLLGGQTDCRYLLHCTHVINVEEVDANGCCTWRLCFAPSGHLPMGDMLLAQKISLELLEDAALAVAGHWGANAPGPWFWSRHS